MPNLTLTTSVAQSYVSNSKGRVASVVLSVVLTDTRSFVVYKPIRLEIDWGDGSQIEVVQQQPSPYTNAFQHTYSVGNYILKVTGRNFQVPVPETAVASHDINVASAQPKTPTLAEQGLQPIIFGPILPRDEGFPNKDEWAFQSSQDNLLLESSARMLLITKVGDRLMNPEYGTKIPLFIFDPSLPSLQDDVNQEVVRAFSIHEPRLAVTTVSLQQLGEKQVQVMVGLASKLDQRQFVIATTFVKS